jgi:hypothetical protein
MPRKRENKRRRGQTEADKVFLGLRAQLIEGDPASFGLLPAGRFPNVWGALMEQGISGAVASVVSLTDGTTSYYTSTGGGVIGGGAHAQVREATYAFLDAVEASLDLTTPTDILRLPEQDEVRFNVLAYEGPRSASAPRADLEAGSHPLGELFRTAHGVITELRLLQESGR